MTLEIQNLLLNLIYYLSSISVITAGIIYLAKISIKYFTDKGVEKYKVSLNKELETFKSDLKIKEAEYQVKFSRLHETRAQTIKELYVLSINLQNSIFQLTQPSQGPDWYKNKELNTNMFNSLKTFQRYFIANKILINSDLCEKLSKFIDRCYVIETEMEEAKILGESDDNAVRNESVKIWIKQFNAYLNDIKNINDSLIEEFRKLLGVN